MYKYIFYILFSTQIIVFAQDEFMRSQTTVGGYGELHYNKTINESSTKNELDFHRFVVFYGFQWNEDWSFKAEVELEHNFVSEGEGELEIEQALVDYHFRDYLAFQTGVILPSIGLLNELHEPPLFFGVERPDYAKYIIPTTWFGNGAAIYGNYNNFNYRFTVMEGLNANKISYSNAIRNGRQKGYKSKADDLLYNGSIEYLGLPGLKVGASVTYNNATGDSNNIAVTLLEAHFKYAYNNLMLVGEFGNISYGSGNLKTSRGYYFDLGYDVSNIFGVKTQIIPFARYTNYNTAFSTIESGDSEKMFSRAKWMIGMNILPISEVVFKIDYSETEAGLTNQITKNFNLGVGYMF